MLTMRRHERDHRRPLTGELIRMRRCGRRTQDLQPARAMTGTATGQTIPVAEGKSWGGWRCAHLTLGAFAQDSALHPGESHGICSPIGIMERFTNTGPDSNHEPLLDGTTPTHRVPHTQTVAVRPPRSCHRPSLPRRRRSCRGCLL
jgi:hypothetical protein